jgi:hypothetical protein
MSGLVLPIAPVSIPTNVSTPPFNANLPVPLVATILLLQLVDPAQIQIVNFVQFKTQFKNAVSVKQDIFLI